MCPSAIRCSFFMYVWLAHSAVYLFNAQPSSKYKSIDSKDRELLTISTVTHLLMKVLPFCSIQIDAALFQASNDYSHIRNYAKQV